MRRRPVALIAALLLAGCGAPPYSRIEFVGSYSLDARQDWFGGFSGFDTADGIRFAMISDRGFTVVGRLRRQGDKIAGMRRSIRTIEPPPGSRIDDVVDTEGLVLDGERLFVSVEDADEVWQLRWEDAQAQLLPRDPAFDRLAENRSFEALAMDPEGRLVMLPEVPRGGVFPLWRLEGGAWRQVAELPAGQRFRAVGADYGPEGRLYLLERRFDGPLGFASRIRRFDLDAPSLGEELLWRTGSGEHGNLEGLAVWRDASGATRFTMVSDDNLMFFQRNEIVEYRLVEVDRSAAAR